MKSKSVFIFNSLPTSIFWYPKSRKMCVPMKLQPHSWKCDPIQRHIPISLLVGSTPRSLFKGSRCPDNESLSLFLRFHRPEIKSRLTKCRKRTKPNTLGEQKIYYMTKFDQVHTSLARVGMIDLLYAVRIEKNWNLNPAFDYENKRRRFFSFKFGWRTKLLIIISPYIFFFKGSR